MLPSVSPSSVDWMNVSTRRGSCQTRAARQSRAARCGSLRLADQLVLAVCLDLEDVELRVQRVVGLRRPAELSTKDPVVDPHLLHVPDHVTALNRAMARVASEL